MSKLLGPDFIALQVHDVAVSSRFYEEVVGLERSPQSPPGAVVFNTQPIPFAVRAPFVDLEAVGQLGWGVALWFLTEDSPQLLAKLQAAEVSIIAPLAESPFGQTFTFRDPDGYLITVHDKA